MELIIRKGKEQDIPGVMSLIKELAIYEKAPSEVTNTEMDMLRDGFGADPIYKLIIAEQSNEIVGMAIYFIKYSTWKGKGIYLDDIVVKEKFRRSGIGKKLFNAVVSECKILDARQLHWQVLDWNAPAIEFYKKYAASFDGEWINCKLNASQINNFQS